MARPSKSISQTDKMNENSTGKKAELNNGTRIAVHQDETFFDYITERLYFARKQFGIERPTIAEYCKIGVPQVHNFETKGSGSKEILFFYMHYLVSNYNFNPSWAF